MSTFIWNSQGENCGVVGWSGRAQNDLFQTLEEPLKFTHISPQNSLVFLVIVFKHLIISKFTTYYFIILIYLFDLSQWLNT